MIDDDTLQQFTSEALAHKAKSSGCEGLEGLVSTPRTIKGWSILLSVHEHGGIDHWHFSALLSPQTRRATKTDEKMLDYIISNIQKLTGYPSDAPEIKPLTPAEKTRPNHGRHWAWHADGSSLDPVMEARMRSALRW